MPIWINCLGFLRLIPKKYVRGIRDGFYARVSVKTVNQDWLSSFADEVKTILVDVKVMKIRTDSHLAQGLEKLQHAVATDAAY